MNREFRNLYNQELKILREQAREFAEEYPGIADRLGRRARRPGRSHDRRFDAMAPHFSPRAFS